MSPVLVDMLGQFIMGTIFTGLFLAVVVYFLARLVRGARRAANSIKNVRDNVYRNGSPYVRMAFGPAWKDTDKNGRDTRNDILHRDLEDVRMTSKGMVISGILRDPYTGQTINFSKTNPTTVHIDHIFPLSLAWARGADGWTQDKREQFANDPLNLFAASSAANSAKSNSSIDQWLPLNQNFHFTYVRHFALVAQKYGIPLTESEQNIISDITGMVTDAEVSSAFLNN